MLFESNYLFTPSSCDCNKVISLDPGASQLPPELIQFTEASKEIVYIQIQCQLSAMRKQGWLSVYHASSGILFCQERQGLVTQTNV